MYADEDRAIAHAEIKAESKEQRNRRAWFLSEDEDYTDFIEANRKRQKELERDIARIKRLLEEEENDSI